MIIAMERCYDNDTIGDLDTAILYRDDQEASSGSFLDYTLDDVMSCPPYIVAALVAVQLVTHVLLKGKKEKVNLGKLDILSVTLTLVLAFILSLKMSTESDAVESTRLPSPRKQLLFSARNQIATYFLVAFLALLEKIKVSNMPLILFLFWSSTFVSLSINFYGDYINADSRHEKVTMFWIDLTHIVIVALQCFLLYVRRKKAELENEKRSGVSLHPKENASWLSNFTLFWTLGIIKIGAKRPLEESDVYDLAPEDQSRNAVMKFERNLRIEELVNRINNDQQYSEQETTQDKELDGNNTQATARVSLLTVLRKTFGFKFLFLQSIKVMAELINFVNPILLAVFMNHIEARDKEHWTKGILIVCGIFVFDEFNNILHHRIWTSILRFGKQVRASIILVVFKKALVVRNEATKDMTTGEIVNLISDDCDRVINLSQEFFHIISTPLVVGISLYLLHDLVGCAMFSGLVIMLLLIPLNSYVGRKLKALNVERDEAKDKRIKLMNEIVNGIKVLKLYAWELSFMKKVQNIRHIEENCNNSISFFHACIDSMFRAIPFLVKIGSFGVYLLLGGRLDAATAFVTINLFHTLNHPFSLMPLLIPRYVEAAASLKRIEKFMNGEDIPHDNVVRKAEAKSAISISEGEFTWEKNTETNTLRNINVNIPKGSLVAVVGMVGTGKSSLLSALLGEMEKLKGAVEVRGKVAYVPQEAWVLNAPLRGNVLFGSRMETNRYKRVVNACALKDDINMMSAGDNTEIGEKGINLSGGQKQRLSLARALYNDADIFLLDDPLSAVDAHVGKHIFNKVISHKGLLQGKTRVLVTHGLHWLPRVDSIIVMKDGEISESGTYEQLLSHNGTFAQFLRNATTSSSDDSDPNVHKLAQKTLNRLASMNDNTNENNDLKTGINVTEKESTDISSRENSSSESSADEEDHPKDLNDFENGDDKDGALIDDEELEQGQVDKKVYLEYIKAVGYRSVLCFAVLYIVTSSCGAFASSTLKQWTDDPILGNESLAASEKYNENNWKYFSWFALSGSVEVVTAFLYVAVILRGTFKAATRLHNNLLYRILRCPMSFFDTTPSCRIITRFSKDVSRVDGLGGCLRALICQFFNMIIFLALIIVNCPTVSLYLVPVSIAYYVLFNFHVGSIRQLRRFRSKYRSPMYGHFTETLNGLSSIRAYACQGRFIKSMEKHIDDCSKFDLVEMWTSLGLGIRSSLLYHLVAMIAGIVCVMDTSMTAGMVGLVIMYARDFSGTMNGFFWTLTHTETEIVSLEKLIEYSNKPSEAEWETTAETKPALEWPGEGNVSFNQYKARYREGLDLVLKGVDCQIQSGEKVGIVGRTGAGKTSLTMAFFRLVEAADGNITVDDKNIADLGLHNLRSRINILPQEPVIFSGTLRMNLDPFGKHSDEDIWIALQRSHLESFVNGLPNKLEYECGEGGKNLSVGQRQLLCLARTLLRKTKILVLDEATAAVDMETDELIQKTIRTEFSDCTVLTIAHRLNTILDYDKILVLEYGMVKEFDSPGNLLADEESTFHSMAKDAKLV